MSKNSRANLGPISNVKDALSGLTPHMVGEIVRIMHELPALPPGINAGFWVDRRRENFRAAETYLRARGVLVSIVNRDDLVRTYRVTGITSPLTADGVVGLAVAQYGFEVPA